MSIESLYKPGALLQSRSYFTGTVVKRNDEGYFDITQYEDHEGRMRTIRETIRADERVLLLAYKLERLSSRAEESAFVLRLATNSILWLNDIDFAHHLKVIEI